MLSFLSFQNFIILSPTSTCFPVEKGYLVLLEALTFNLPPPSLDVYPSAKFAYSCYHLHLLGCCSSYVAVWLWHRIFISYCIFFCLFLEKSGEEGMLFSDSEIDLGTSTVIKSYFWLSSDYFTLIFCSKASVNWVIYCTAFFLN